MAARSIWNGTITFGMVNVPVKLYTATESKTIHFHLVHARDGSRIENRRICSKEDKEVPYKQVVKGYEVSRGQVRRPRARRDQGRGRRPRQGRAPRRSSSTQRRSTRCSSRRPITWAARRQGRLPPAARGAAPQRARRDRPLHLPRPGVPGGGARSRRRDRAAHAALPRRGRRRRRPGHRAPWPQALDSVRCRWPGSSIDSMQRELRPRGLRGQLSRIGARADQAQGGRQGDRSRRSRRSPSTATT